MEITIKEKTIQLKKTFRSLIAYESAMGKSFKPETFTEYIMYFYCVIIASDLSIELTYDEFINWLDENPNVLDEFSQWILEQNNREAKLTKKKTVKKAEKN